MATCSECRHWRPKYLDTSEAGWRTRMLIEAEFGGCVSIEEGIKTTGLSEPDIDAQIVGGAFILGDFATLVTHSTFGCNQFKGKP